ADFMLPIDFAGTRAAAAANARSRAQARALLKAGGCLIVFPSAAVSTAPHPFAPAVDPEWQPFAGRLIQQGRAAVLPIFVEGENSRLFQLASQVSLTLRLSLLMWELTRRMGTTVSLRIGPVIPFEALPEAGGPATRVAVQRLVNHALAEGDAPAVRPAT